MMGRKERMRERAKIMRTLRDFFWHRGFFEVDTPIALTSVAPEPHIEAPRVIFSGMDGQARERFLQTSPELPMKRLLAAGFERIFQIAPVFRDGDFSPSHRPEFRLLEWYRRGESWLRLMDDCEALLRTCAAVVGKERVLAYGGRRVELEAPFVRLTVDEAFRQYVGFSILDHLDDSLRAVMTKLGLRSSPEDSWDDLFHRVFLNFVEPRLLEQPRPVFLTHYPAPLAALARLSPHDPRVAQRFELYVAGIELANAFGELTDPRAQRLRFERDRQQRIAAGLADYPIDERFLAALADLPESAGIALGIERLLMLLLDASHIDEVLFIPWSET